MEVFSCENGLYVNLSLLAWLLSWFSPFGLLEPEKPTKKSTKDWLHGWAGPLNKPVKSAIVKKSYGQNVFHEDIFFYEIRIHFPTFFSRFFLFFHEHSVFLGQLYFAYGFSKLSLMFIKYAQNLAFQKYLVLIASMKTLWKWWMFFISSEKLFSFII